MNDGTYRGRWAREVFRTPRVSAEVKVFLLFLERYHMEPNGRVCEPRELLADEIGCHPRKITAKFKSAIDGGLLRLIVRGQKHVTAVYQASIPDPQVADTRPPETGPQVAGPRHPERSQVAADYHPETVSQGAGTRPPENGPIYKARARAHSKGDRSSTTATTEDDDSRPGGVVVALFNEDIEPSLRSHTADLRSAARETPDRFDEFWKTYPRRVGKGAARKAWDKAIKNGADPEEVIWGARRYSTDPRRAAADIRYTAHPATWLNAERWTDEDAPAPAPTADPRQQATNDRYERAMQRAIAREEGR